MSRAFGDPVNADVVASLLRDAFWTVLLAAGPVLAVALAAGIVVGLFQAATQIHEMTLVFVPKLLLVALVTAVLGHWQWAALVRFAERMITALPQAAR